VKKTIIVHMEGLPSQSMARLECPTPLQRAATPNLDELAEQGEMGQLGMPGESRPFSGELALLALLGYDTTKWYGGAGLFEAAGLEVKLDKHDVAFLCHLVTLRSRNGWGEGKKLGSLVMEDPYGGGIGHEDARELIDSINDQLVSENIQFYFGRDYRHLMVWAGGGMKMVCRNPREAIGQTIDAFLPAGDGAPILRELMEASRVILSHHEVNQERIRNGLNPANCLWLWGPGKAMELPKITDRWPIKGAVVATEGPILGAGAGVGLHTVLVDEVKEGGSVGFKAWLSAGLQALEKRDFVYLHFPIGTHEGRPEDVVQHWEEIDSHVIGPIRSAFLSEETHRLLIMATSIPDCRNSPKEALAGYLYCGGESRSTGKTTKFQEQELASRPFKDATKFFERFVIQ
jgi:2,3-bisphosphoglycerate-independent phosphoglycerate mutase